MSWIKDIISPEHGVNCTGGCSWQIHVKDGIVVWETQQLDYPLLEDSLPPYEPRGCQRGISFSWYLYSPLRIKYPLVRSALLDAYREEKKKTGDPMKAWEALQADEKKRKAYQQARGKGGFRRASWDDVTYSRSWRSPISTLRRSMVRTGSLVSRRFPRCQC